MVWELRQSLKVPVAVVQSVLSEDGNSINQDKSKWSYPHWVVRACGFQLWSKFSLGRCTV